MDEVKYAYDGWSNIATIEQDVNSAVGAMGSVDDYDVSFSYAKATNGRNTLRRTGVTLPSSDAVGYTYSNAHALHDEEASRVSSVTFTVGARTTVATYQYNGQGHLVNVNLPEPGVFSFRSGATSGSYPDLDRFNRITTSDWTSGSVDFYSVDLTYDRNGNIETLNDHVHDGFDVLFTMDDLNRLIDAQEGTLSSGSISSETRQETWTLGQTGTWEIFQRDLDGDGLYIGASELDDGRAFSAANELVERDTKRDGTPDYAPTYDAVGNLVDDEEHYQYIYDAFGRLRKVQTTGVSPRPVAEYTYNGLNWRIGRHYDVDGDNSVDGDDPWYYSVFDDMWRVVAVYRGSDSSPKEQYVYHAAGLDGRGGSSYIDDVILRDFDDTGGWGSASDGMFETRQYYCQNWRHDVVAVINERGGQVEQVRYSSYGVPFGLPAGDADSDGDVESSDLSQINTWAGGTYDVRGDLDLDGDVDGTDHTIATARHGDRMGRQTLSLANNRLGYAGYRWMSELEGAYGFHHVRHRVLNSSLGLWTTRDPLGYVDAVNLYSYVAGDPTTRLDPMGLCTIDVSYRLEGWEVGYWLFMPSQLTGYVYAGTARSSIDLKCTATEVDYLNSQDISQNPFKEIVIDWEEGWFEGSIESVTTSTIDNEAKAKKVSLHHCGESCGWGVVIRVNFLNKAGRITTKDWIEVGGEAGPVGGGIGSETTTENPTFKNKNSAKLTLCPDGQGGYDVVDYSAHGGGIHQEPGEYFNFGGWPGQDDWGGHKTLYRSKWWWE